jgi:hypothetical protein
MFQYKILGATVVFDVEFIQNTLEARLRIKFWYIDIDIDIRGKMPVGCQNGVGRSAESMV